MMYIDGCLLEIVKWLDNKIASMKVNRTNNNEPFTNLVRNYEDTRYAG